MGINSISKSDDEIKITPLGKSISLEMELDTGAAVIPEKIFNGKDETKFNCVKTYTGGKIKPVGVADVDMKYKKQRKNLKLYVVRKAGVTLFDRIG